MDFRELLCALVFELVLDVIPSQPFDGVSSLFVGVSLPIVLKEAEAAIGPRIHPDRRDGLSLLRAVHLRAEGHKPAVASYGTAV